MPSTQTDAERIADLEEQVAYWKGLAQGTPSQVSALRRAFRMEPFEARIAMLLYSRKGSCVLRTEMREAVESQSESESWPSTYIRRIRRKLPPNSIGTESQSRVGSEDEAGYYMTDAGLRAVKAALVQRPAKP